MRRVPAHRFVVTAGLLYCQGAKAAGHRIWGGFSANLAPLILGSLYACGEMAGQREDASPPTLCALGISEPQTG